MNDKCGEHIENLINKYIKFGWSKYINDTEVGRGFANPLKGTVPIS